MKNKITFPTDKKEFGAKRDLYADPAFFNQSLYLQIRPIVILLKHIIKKRFTGRT